MTDMQEEREKMVEARKTNDNNLFQFSSDEENSDDSEEQAYLQMLRDRGKEAPAVVDNQGLSDGEPIDEESKE